MSSLFSVGMESQKGTLFLSEPSPTRETGMDTTFHITSFSGSWDRLNWGRMGEPSSLPTPKSCGGVPSKWAQWGGEYDISGTGKGI